MLVYRISKCKYIDDLNGTGASLFPGRWHSKGTYVLYTAANSSLALLESIVHITQLSVEDFCMTCLDIPDKSGALIEASKLPDNWNDNPPPDALKKIGDTFIKENKFLYLGLPSAVMPEDYNYLINPAHPDFKMVKQQYIRSVSIDQRFFKMKPQHDK